jgi:hypothetical protein
MSCLNLVPCSVKRERMKYAHEELNKLWEMGETKARQRARTRDIKEGGGVETPNTFMLLQIRGGEKQPSMLWMGLRGQLIRQWKL